MQTSGLFCSQLYLCGIKKILNIHGQVSKKYLYLILAYLKHSSLDLFLVLTNFVKVSGQVKDLAELKTPWMDECP